MLKRLKQIKSHVGYKWWRFKYAIQSRLATVNERPIIILGNQKSGTTAIAALVAKRAGLTATLDLIEMSADDERTLHRSADGLSDLMSRYRLEFSRDVIKEPRLTFVYPELRQRFPGAQFVFIVRDPRANVRSILDRLTLPCSLEPLDRATRQRIKPVWELVVDGTWMGIEGATYVETLSKRWNRAANVYLHHSNEMLLVRYEDFKADKIGVIDSIVASLNLKPTKNIEGSLKTAFQPRGDRRDMDLEDVFDPAALHEIERICGDTMTKFGYTPTLSA